MHLSILRWHMTDLELCKEHEWTKKGVKEAGRRKGESDQTARGLVVVESLCCERLAKLCCLTTTIACHYAIVRVTTGGSAGKRPMRSVPEILTSIKRALSVEASSMRTKLQLPAVRSPRASDNAVGAHRIRDP